MTDGTWATVWSDQAEIEKITNATASQLTSWKDRISAGEVTLKFPFFEYTTGHVDSKLPLDFEREASLINSLESLSPAKFSEVLKARTPFKPFVAMIEGAFLVVYDMPEYYRCRWSYLRQSHLLSEDSLQKIDSLLTLTNWEIEERFKKGKLTEKGSIQTFDIDLIKEAEQRNPEANQLVFKHVLKEKPVNIVVYNENKYLAIAFDKPMQPPTVLFPESYRTSIPNAGIFYGRVCGIVNFIANPPPLFSNSVLQTAILALQFNY